MFTVLKHLDDPYLVVKFQRYFGVVPNEKQAIVKVKYPESNEGEVETLPACVSQAKVNHVKKRTSKHSGTSPNPQNNKNGYVCSKNDIKTDSGAYNSINCKENVGQGSTISAPGSVWDIVSNQERGIDEKWETDEYIITKKTFYYLFNFGACLGNEIFYITFFPFWLWNIDSFVGRRVCIFWALFMYLGQVTKDLLKIPRPASPPVIRMEKLYALEFGMPSTHAMVGAGFPFSILILTWQRYVYPFELGLIAAFLWTTIVCCSRLYLGMHSVLDVICGLLYVFALMPVVFPVLETLDEFLVQSPFSPLVVLAIPVILGIYYPKLDRWSTARGDTTVILSVSAGVILGMWLSFHHGYMKPASIPPPYPVIYPDWTWMWHMMLRMVIGVVILVATRQILKPITFRVSCYLNGRNVADKGVYKCLAVELPYKYLTYTTVAFNAVYVVPLIFRYLGIERQTYFTEI